MHRVRKQGAIAQSVEQRTENPCVPGSIPGGTTLEQTQEILSLIFLRKSGFFSKNNVACRTGLS